MINEKSIISDVIYKMMVNKNILILKKKQYLNI